VKAGDAVVLVDGKGAEAAARVMRISKDGIEVAVERLRAPEAPAPAISLLVAAVRLERLSWIAEKATELGATRLVLLTAGRTQSFRAAAAASGRLERVARAAAKQSGAAAWPEIVGPIAASQALAAEMAPTRLLLDASGAPFPAALAPNPAAIAIGPEGGWAPEELAAAKSLGWSVVRLPAGMLRAETAAIAALALLRAARERGESPSGTSV
jgi:16S rRNA (uracil1498-N3)-methyltransferase